MIGAGKLDRRVQFQRATIADDGLTQAETWGDHGSPVWASKKDVSDGERLAAGELASTITARFVVRDSTFTVDLTPADRLVCSGKTYDISGIKEIEARGRYLEITAAARSDG